MKITKFDNELDWLNARRGKITGTRLGDVVTKRGAGRKIGFYELIAERIGIPADDQSAMERGKLLQDEALDVFERETGKKVDRSLCLWMRDDNDAIAVSPDGAIGKTEAVETKCLSSARHIEAFITGQIPKDHEDQALQYFIVNDKLRRLHFAFYDPRIPAKPFFTILINRKDKEQEIEHYLEYERAILGEIDEIVNALTEF